jgi:hypothetical protein
MEYIIGLLNSFSLHQLWKQGEKIFFFVLLRKGEVRLLFHLLWYIPLSHIGRVSGYIVAVIDFINGSNYILCTEFITLDNGLGGRC